MTARTINGTELAAAADAALAVMAGDSRVTSVEVAIPLSAERDGRYDVYRDGTIRLRGIELTSRP